MKPGDCSVGDIIRKGPDGKLFVVQYASDVNVVAHYTISLRDMTGWERVNLYLEKNAHGGPPTDVDDLP